MGTSSPADASSSPDATVESSADCQQPSTSKSYTHACYLRGLCCEAVLLVRGVTRMKIVSLSIRTDTSAKLGEASSSTKLAL